nr:hypothetical protein [Tanacetum cinerariifolium]
MTSFNQHCTYGDRNPVTCYGCEGPLNERGEHAAQISTPNWKCPIFYDDDDEYSIQYREYLENSSNAIAPEEPDNSLSIGDEHISTISETKSDEVINSSVEDLVPIPSDEVELLLHRDPSTLIMSFVSILEGVTDEPPLEENDGLFDLEYKKNEWKKILYDAPINDLMTEDKVFDPETHDQIFSPTYVGLPFEDRHYLFFTYVVRIFHPHFTYLVDSPFLLSSESEDTIFDPDISAFHFFH